MWGGSGGWRWRPVTGVPTSDARQWRDSLHASATTHAARMRILPSCCPGLRRVSCWCPCVQVGRLVCAWCRLLRWTAPRFGSRDRCSGASTCETSTQDARARRGRELASQPFFVPCSTHSHAAGAMDTRMQSLVRAAAAERRGEVATDACMVYLEQWEVMRTICVPYTPC